MLILVRILATMLALGLSVAGASAAPPMVAVCAECHGADGMGQGLPMIPVIAGMPAPHIEDAIYAYVDGARQCVREPRMCETVSSLSEAEVGELAGHYSSLEREFSGVEFDPGLVSEGEALHLELCSQCHWRPEKPGIEDALGIPLHGQRPDYLRLALEEYKSGARLALLDAMAEKINALRPGDFEALVNYYASYRSDGPSQSP